MKTFKGVGRQGQSLFTRQAELNIAEWLRWSLLHCGSFINITSGDATKLRPVDDPNYTAGRLWGSRRTGWIWESGVSFSPTPVAASNVLVNGTAAASHIIRYPLGQILFDTAISTTATVSANYSCRYTHVYMSDEPWVYSLDTLSMDTDDSRFQAAFGKGGDLAVLAERRAQLPLYAIAPVGRFVGIPYELGNTSSWTSLDFMVTCIAETPTDRTWLHDALCAQLDTSISTYDINQTPAIYQSAGQLVTSPLNYSERCDAYPWRPLRVKGIRTGSFSNHGGLHWAQIILTLEIGVMV